MLRTHETIDIFNIVNKIYLVFTSKSLCLVQIMVFLCYACHTHFSLSVPGLYYGITIAIVSATTAMTVLTLNIHHKGSRGLEVPQSVKKVFFGIFAKILFIKLDLPHPPQKDMVCIVSLHYCCTHNCLTL